MIKLIAIGNRLMKDDAIALVIADYLKDRLADIGIQTVIGETDFQFCLNLIKNDCFFIVLDAVYTGGTPGQIHVSTIDEAVSWYRKPYSQHEFSLFDLIGLYRLDIKGYMIGVEVAEIGYGDELSGTLKEKVEDISIQVEKSIKCIMEDFKMHDTVLYEKTYRALLALCSGNSINKVTSITVAVDEDSHMDGSSLYEYLKRENSTLIGNWTKIKLEREAVGRLTAVIKSVEGERSDE